MHKHNRALFLSIRKMWNSNINCKSRLSYSLTFSLCLARKFCPCSWFSSLCNIDLWGYSFFLKLWALLYDIISFCLGNIVFSSLILSWGILEKGRQAVNQWILSESGLNPICFTYSIFPLYYCVANTWVDWSVHP